MKPNNTRGEGSVRKNKRAGRPGQAEREGEAIGYRYGILCRSPGGISERHVFGSGFRRDSMTTNLKEK